MRTRRHLLTASILLLDHLASLSLEETYAILAYGSTTAGHVAKHLAKLLAIIAHTNYACRQIDERWLGRRKLKAVGHAVGRRRRPLLRLLLPHLTRRIQQVLYAPHAVLQRDQPTHSVWDASSTRKQTRNLKRRVSSEQIGFRRGDRKTKHFLAQSSCKLHCQSIVRHIDAFWRQIIGCYTLKIRCEQ